MYFKEGPLPKLSEDEDDALRLVIYDVEMAAEEYIVEDLQRSIRQVWEVALRIGVKHGQREARQAHTATPKELERERVWGYDVDWRLAMEAHALKASYQPVPTSPFPSVSTSPNRTDPPPPTLSDAPRHDPFSPPPSPSLPSLTTCATQMSAVDTTSPSVTRLDDARSRPAHLSTTSPCATPARDFSILRSAESRPFASLQRRHRRSTGTRRSLSSYCRAA
ncbi:hypothetical protein DFH09DRAFT_1468579 [Mycena vulgaris]|nr:hypothetical protein DFH09DRAFT_1468579 [Mycena vulgaris]